MPSPAPAEGPRPFSISQWRTYQRCATQYEFAYLKGGESSANSLMIRGRGLDEAASHNYRQKETTHRDVRLREVLDVAASAVDTAFHGRVVLTKEERAIGQSLVRGALVDETVRFARVYHQNLAPTVQPAEGGVQERILVKPSASVLPRPLVGIPDVRLVDTGFLDVKAKKARLPEGAEHIDLQLTAYAALIQARHGFIPKYVGLDMVYGGRGKRIGHERRLSTRTREDIVALVQNFRSTIAAIDAGSFPPTGIGTWACSEESCPFWYDCPFVRGARERVSPAGR